MTISETIGVAAFYGIFGTFAVFGVVATAWLALSTIFGSLVGQFAAPVVLIKSLINLLRKR